MHTRCVVGSTPVVVFGEVLYDCFPDGKRVLGGAPFNVAWALCGLGQTPVFISAVGADADGRNILNAMKGWGMSQAGVRIDAQRATGVVQVAILNGEPNYDICEDRAWDAIIDAGWSAAKLIYHGSLALRTEQNQNALSKLVNHSTAKRFFDVNLRTPYDSLDKIKPWLHGVEWLKLNLDELKFLLGDDSIQFDDVEDAVCKLRKLYDVANVFLTGGSQGARLDGDVGHAICNPAPVPYPFVDTVGAGDAFSAYAMLGILGGLEIDEIVQQSCQFAAKVCGHRGATTNDRSFYR